MQNDCHEFVEPHCECELGYPSFGDIVLEQHLRNQATFRRSSYLERLSFIEACLRIGINTEKAIVAKAKEIGGEDYEHGLVFMLQWHSMATAQPHLWDRRSGDEFVLRETSVV